MMDSLAKIIQLFIEYKEQIHSLITLLLLWIMI